MAIRRILIHPDPRLKRVTDPVEIFDTELASLVEDMYETMYKAPGIGLAAPQIGVMSQVLVMDCAMRADEEDGEAAKSPPPPPDPITIINPKITWASEEMSTYKEGCLSIPDQYDDVERPAKVRVAYQDAQGAAHEREFDGLNATCVQHEIDHLQGKLFIDYLGPVRRAMITQKMKKLKRERAKKAKTS